MEYPYKLTIITINLNNKDGLQKTIESVINQTCQDFEWVVIDGGSTDGSKELIEKYSDHINYWVSEPDKGIYNAMNKGIIASRGECFLFLNSGDRLCNYDVINNILPELENADFYLGNQIQNFKIKNIKIENNHDLITYLSQYPLPHQSLFINKRVFIKYGLYREDYRIFSDWILCFEALIKGNAIIKKIDHTISIYDTTGISFSNDAMEEWKRYMSEAPNLFNLIEFYNNNYNSIQLIRKSFFTKLIYQLVNLYNKNICRLKKICPKSLS